MKWLSAVRAPIMQIGSRSPSARPPAWVDAIEVTPRPCNPPNHSSSPTPSRLFARSTYSVRFAMQRSRSGGNHLPQPGETRRCCLPRTRANHPLPDMDWSWSLADENKWDDETEVYGEFCNHRRDRVRRPDFPNKFSYELSLGPIPCTLSSWGETILVTEAYHKTFPRIVDLRHDDKTGKAKGVVIAGQPGVGAFHHQILASCDDSSAVPFSRKNYIPKVHSRGAAFVSAGCTLVRLH